MIETGINRRWSEDILPANSSLNQQVRDNFLEFNISGSDTTFIDLSTISLELKISIVNNIDDDFDLSAHNALFVDGLFHRLFKSHTVYLNGTQVEGNQYFGIYNNIKMLCETDVLKFDNFSDLMFYYDHENNFEKYNTAASFNAAIMTKSKLEPLHLRGLLMLDTGSMEQYLVSGVDVRIRLELSNFASVIMSNSDKSGNLSYKIDEAKLWIDRIEPNMSALLSLNKAINRVGAIDYIYERPVTKTVIFPKDHRNIIIDNPFNSIIPRKIYMVMIAQDAMNGDYITNPCYFHNLKMTHMEASINGETLMSFNSKFPNEAASAYYSTLCGIGLDKANHSVRMSNFVDGHSIFVMNTESDQSDDKIALERNGNMRIKIDLSESLTKNFVIILIGQTMGTISITPNRRVHSDVLQ